MRHKIETGMFPEYGKWRGVAFCSCGWSGRTSARKDREMVRHVLACQVKSHQDDEARS